MSTPISTPLRRIRVAGAAAALLMLSACEHANIFEPSGDVAQRQAHLVLLSTGLMLLIIVPVMLLTAFFAWHFRAGNRDASYDPEFHHSTKVELVVWSAPLAIIIALGSVTWVYTHLLDPFRPLDRLAEGQPVTAADKPLEVEVVALDWKWLFIYPEQKVASVNELALPTGRPVHFRLTSATVMNSFFVPAIAGQIYAMPGMASQLNAVVNKPGTFRGFSANYSGAGFSQMHFNTLGLEPAAFDKWVADTKAAGGNLDAATYLKLAEPTIAEPVHHFGAVSADLFDKVVNLCVEPGKMCVNQMAMLDARGGTGKAGLFNLAQLTYDKDGRPNLTPLTAARQAQLDQRLNKAFVAALCATGPAPLAAKAPKLTLSQPAPSPLS